MFQGRHEAQKMCQATLLLFVEGQAKVNRSHPASAQTARKFAASSANPKATLTSCKNVIFFYLFFVHKVTAEARALNGDLYKKNEKTLTDTIRTLLPRKPFVWRYNNNKRCLFWFAVEWN